MVLGLLSWNYSKYKRKFDSLDCFAFGFENLAVDLFAWRPPVSDSVQFSSMYVKAVLWNFFWSINVNR